MKSVSLLEILEQFLPVGKMQSVAHIVSIVGELNNLGTTMEERCKDAPCTSHSRHAEKINSADDFSKTPVKECSLSDVPVYVGIQKQHFVGSQILNANRNDGTQIQYAMHTIFLQIRFGPTAVSSPSMEASSHIQTAS